MATLTPAQAELFRKPNYAVLTTLRADGTPHNTPVWVDIDDAGTVSVNTAEGRAKHRHILANPNVAVTIMDEPYKWVSISGRATLHSNGVDDQINSLAKKYLGEDVYPWRGEGEVRIAFTIAIDKIDAFGL